MAKIKFVATDMDGTLLNSKKEIHEEFYEVFKEMKEKNIIFAAASGRQYYSLLETFDNIKDDMMFIAENGTFVMYKGKEIVTNTLDRELAMELVSIARKVDEGYTVLCGKNSAYIESDDSRLVNEVSKYYKRYKIVDDITTVDDDILKVTICDFKGAEENSNNYFTEYRDKAQVTVSGEIWLDITAKNVNKGVAIKEIQDLLGIKYEETAVFGDYLNDLEMMSSGYYSYAMKNAHEDLKKVARFIAKSNDENGVVEAIKELIR
ncbi:Cof-type HAD-IIB family hydrolase [Clostridium bornimense]|uniref:HAD family hydrolase n=1 Tax=Clostridium bornimense TaxID=1216932 RepID=UPI001C117EB8|nr:Cof-type HAD-IIB family hydrolase [Clostridium bornimense]MBU5316172.1 Cof-type HAD-IIB family hydrolase [Clostridium bornimense]